MNGVAPPVTFRVFVVQVGANVRSLLTTMSGGETVRMVGWLVTSELDRAIVV